MAFKRGIPQLDQPEVGPRALPHAQDLVQYLWSGEIRPELCEDQRQGGGRPRNAHMTVHKQMGITWRVNQEITGKPEDFVDMAGLRCHQALKGFQDVVKT